MIHFSDKFYQTGKFFTNKIHLCLLLHFWGNKIYCDWLILCTLILITYHSAQGIKIIIHYKAFNLLFLHHVFRLTYRITPKLAHEDIQPRKFWMIPQILIRLFILHLECVIDLNQQSEMIIFVSLVSTFEANTIF